MKVALVGPLPPPMNGCSYANAVLVKRAAALGVGCVTVDTSTPEVSGHQGSRFSLRKAIRFLSAYLAAGRLVRASVAYMTPGQTFFGLMKYAPFMALSLLLRIPYVIHLHGNHLGKAYAEMSDPRRRLIRCFLSRAAAGIVLSESLRPNFAGLLPPERVFVVENFAGQEIYEERLHSDKQADKLRILYLSNLMREKGILDLLDALILLQQSGVPFDAVIAGKEEPGIEDEVADRLAVLGADARYVGSVSGAAKSELLRQANVSVLPTYYAMEGQPIALLEGMAAGNIIVTTNHAGIPDVVDDANGFLVSPRDPAALAEALSQIARDVAGSVVKYSSHNAAYAGGRFTENAFARRVLEVLAGVMRTRGPVTFPGEKA